MKKWKTKEEREKEGRRFSVIDAHMQLVNSGEKYPEPTLIVKAISVFIPKKKKK